MSFSFYGLCPPDSGLNNQFTLLRYFHHSDTSALKTTVASLGGRRTAPGDTLQGVTPEHTKNFLWANLQRIVDKQGRTGRKGVGDTL